MANTIAKATDSQILFALVARATVARMDGQDIYAWRRERLADLAQKRGGNAALGRELGYRDGAFVGQMIRGIRPITEKTVSAAHALPGAAGWFYLDQEAVSAMQSTSSAGGGMSVANTSPGPDIKGKGTYPVISSVAAGEWTALCDNFHPGDADDWGFSHHDLGRCGYMLRVSGKSMTNTESGARYSFPEGMLLHINPDMDSMPGKFVVVRREAEKEATFKRLTLVDGELYLEAINPDWPNRYLKLMPGDVFCGVVVDASFGSLP